MVSTIKRWKKRRGHHGVITKRSVPKEKTKARVLESSGRTDVTGHAPRYAAVEFGQQGGGHPRPGPRHRHGRPRLRTVARTPAPAAGGAEQRERLAGGDRGGAAHPAAPARGGPLRLPPRRPRPAPASRRSGRPRSAARGPRPPASARNCVQQRRGPCMLDAVIRADLPVSTRGNCAKSEHGPWTASRRNRRARGSRPAASADPVPSTMSMKREDRHGPHKRLYTRDLPGALTPSALADYIDFSAKGHKATGGIDCRTAPERRRRNLAGDTP